MFSMWEGIIIVFHIESIIKSFQKNVYVLIWVFQFQMNCIIENIVKTLQDQFI